MNWGRNLLAGGLLLFGWSLASAEPVELPVTLVPDQPQIVLDLRNCRIDILFDDQADPEIEITNLDEPTQQGGFVLAEVERESLLLSQPFGDEQIAPPLAIHLTLKPETGLTVRGQQLTIRSETASRPSPDPLPPSPTVAAGAAPAQPPPPVFVFKIDDSSLDLVGRAPTISGTRNTINIQEAVGDILAELDGGSCFLKNSTGRLQINGKGTDFRLESVSGTVVFSLQSGRLWLQEGSGSCTGQAQQANVSVEGWRGSLNLDGTGSSVDITRCGMDKGEINLRGEKQLFQLQELAGTLLVDLKESQVDARRIQAGSRLFLRDQTQLVMRGGAHGTHFQLSGGSKAVFSEITDMLNGKAEESSLEFNDVQFLMATVDKGRCSARNSRMVTNITATDADLELNLTQGQSPPRLQLKGSTTARLTLAPPCLLQIEEGALDPQDASATGPCRVQSRQGGNITSIAPPAPGEKRVLLFLGTGVRLSVEEGQ